MEKLNLSLWAPKPRCYHKSFAALGPVAYKMWMPPRVSFILEYNPHPGPTSTKHLTSGISLLSLFILAVCYYWGTFRVLFPAMSLYPAPTNELSAIYASYFHTLSRYDDSFVAPESLNLHKEDIRHSLIVPPISSSVSGPAESNNYESPEVELERVRSAASIPGTYNTTTSGLNQMTIEQRQHNQSFDVHDCSPSPHPTRSQQVFQYPLSWDKSIKVTAKSPPSVRLPSTTGSPDSTSQ